MQNSTAQNAKRSWMKKTHRTVVAAAAIMVSLGLSFASGAATAGEHEGRHAGDRRGYESKIYGTVEKLPQGEAGVWTVSGREITVTRDTRIKEKHGAAEVGSYVEVEGNVSGTTFTAYEIEVKRAKGNYRR